MFDLNSKKYKPAINPLIGQREKERKSNVSNSSQHNQSLTTSAVNNESGLNPQLSMEPTPGQTLRMNTIADETADLLQMSPVIERINPPTYNFHADQLIQPKLEVEDEYPQDYMDKLLPSPKGEDPSKSLTNPERLNYVGGLIGKLSPHFNVDSSGRVGPNGSKKESELITDSKKTASCCLHILTRDSSTNEWKIVVADHLSPHTLDVLHTVLINSEVSPVKFGYHTKKGEKQFYNKPEVILGHELCGHAALEELKAHPEGKRAVTNVHDPTVNIENAIAGEQGVPEEKQRGLAKDGAHGGESFGKMTINHFKLNMSSLSSLPSSEREKMTMLSDMIKRFDLFVELRGHSDNVGSEKAKQDVSDKRALQAFLFLRKMGVSLKAKVKISEAAKIRVNRFLLKGMSDKEPPAGVDPTNQDAFRRVDVFISSFPKGMSGLPSGVKASDLEALNKITEIKEPEKAKELKDKGTPCEKLLVGKAFPKK